MEIIDEKIIISNIQRFSVNDGPGIRTTIFFKGCLLRCPWCANPENLDFQVQKCSIRMKEHVFGKEYDIEALFSEVTKDKAFFCGDFERNRWNITSEKDICHLPGGVTFSGGEPLLQFQKIVPLLKKLKKENIHTCIETSLYAPTESLDIAIKYIDLFYIDFKVWNRNEYAEWLKGDFGIFYENLSRFFQTSNLPFIIRIPIISGYTDSKENIIKIKMYLREKIAEGVRPIKIELLKEHNLGVSKYISLGYKAPAYLGVADETMAAISEMLADLDIPMEICKV